MYVTDTNNNRVQVFDSKGQFLYAFNMRGTSFRQLDGICVGSDQLIYVCDTSNKCVLVFQTSGEFVTSFGQFRNPMGIVIDDNGFVYVSNLVPGSITIL